MRAVQFALVAVLCALFVASHVRVGVNAMPHHRQPARIERVRFAQSRAQARADVNVDAESDGEAEGESEAEGGAQANAEAAVDAQATVLAGEIIAAHEASEAYEAKLAARRGRTTEQQYSAAVAQALANAQAGVTAYDANVHPEVCAHIHAWGSGGGAGAATMAGAGTDAAVMGAWQLVFHALPNADPGRGAHNVQNGPADAAALEIFGVVRVRIAQGMNAVNTCNTARLQAACAMHALTAVPAHIATPSMGLEWELHWITLNPPHDEKPPTACPVATSGANTNPFGLNWVEMVTDHRSGTIVEIAFGADLIDTANNGGGSPTANVLGDMVRVIRNLQVVTVAAGGASHLNRVGNFGEVPTNTIANDLHAANGGANGGTATVRARADLQVVADNPQGCATDANNVPYAGPAVVFGQKARAVKLDLTAAATNAEMFGAEYIQTNALMAVSSICSNAFQTVHVGGGNMQSVRRAVVEAARRAARSYLRSQMNAQLQALHDHERADLLGFVTVMNIHFIGDLVIDATKRDGGKVRVFNRAQLGGFTAHEKNFYDWMLKTSAHSISKLLSPRITDALDTWYATKAFAGLNSAHRNEYIASIQTELAASGDARLQSWGAVLDAGDRTVRGRALKKYADYLVQRRHRLFSPSAVIAAGGGGPNTSPTGAAPPAHRVGNALGGLGWLGLVVESRVYNNALNTAAAAGNVANFNAALNPFMGQRTWDGAANTFCV